METHSSKHRQIQFTLLPFWRNVRTTSRVRLRGLPATSHRAVLVRAYIWQSDLNWAIDCVAREVGRGRGRAMLKTQLGAPGRQHTRDGSLWGDLVIRLFLLGFEYVRVFWTVFWTIAMRRKMRQPQSATVFNSWRLKPPHVRVELRPPIQCLILLPFCIRAHGLARKRCAWPSSPPCPNLSVWRHCALEVRPF